MAHFLQPLLRNTSAQLRNTRSGRPVATVIEAALDSASRKRGLLGRDSLSPGHALIIAPSNLVHTFAMRFHLDILFVSRQGRVLKVRTNVPPRRIAGAFGGFAVVELAAGGVKSSDTRTGDLLEVVT